MIGIQINGIQQKGCLSTNLVCPMVEPPTF